MQVESLLGRRERATLWLSCRWCDIQRYQQCQCYPKLCGLPSHKSSQYWPSKHYCVHWVTLKQASKGHLGQTKEMLFVMHEIHQKETAIDKFKIKPDGKPFLPVLLHETPKAMSSNLLIDDAEAQIEARR